MIRAGAGVFGFLCAVLCAGLLHAEGPEPIVLGSDDIVETLNPNVEVSGGVRAGVMGGLLDEPRGRGRLHVRLPEPPGGLQVCVEITSRDGRYTARFALPETPREPGLYEIRFPTQYSKELDGHSGVYLTALVTLRKSCDGDIEKILLAGWEPPVVSHTFSVFANTGRLETSLYLTTGDDEELVFPCTGLEDEQLVSFDTRCDVELPRGARIAQGHLERRRVFNILDPVSLPILNRRADADGE